MFSAHTLVYLVTNTYHYFLILVENMAGEVEWNMILYFIILPSPLLVITKYPRAN